MRVYTTEARKNRATLSRYESNTRMGRSVRSSHPDFEDPR